MINLDKLRAWVALTKTAVLFHPQGGATAICTSGEGEQWRAAPADFEKMLAGWEPPAFIPPSAMGSNPDPFGLMARSKQLAANDRQADISSNG